MKLTSENVTSILHYCLFNDGENTDNYVEAQGIQVDAGFHPERLKEKEADIVALLMQLPDDYMSNIGGGMSFSRMCIDRTGEYWTDLHSVCEELVLLGTAIKKVSFVLPKRQWFLFPDGMPYIVIKNS